MVAEVVYERAEKTEKIANEIRQSNRELLKEPKYQVLGHAQA